jgi:hypothetical protein
MKIYTARTFGNVFIRKDDDPHFIVPLNPRLDLRCHSPSGCAWGYAGSGPAQLSLALVADATGDDELALNIYQAFKDRAIATKTQDTAFRMDELEVKEHVLAIQERVRIALEAVPPRPFHLQRGAATPNQGVE